MGGCGRGRSVTRRNPEGAAFLAGFHASAAAMGFAFTVIVASGGSPITPELYGPDVYAIPAMAWGITQASLGITCAVSICAGRMLPLAVAAFLSALYYATLGSMALRADQGTLVAVGAFTVMLWPCLAALHYATKRLGRRGPR